MADAVTTDIVFSGGREYVMHITNLCDGTGESAVTKLDISALLTSAGAAPTAVALLEAKWTVQGFTYITLAWDHTTNDTMLRCAGNDYVTFRDVGGLLDPRSAGATGDIVLTTVGNTAGDTYDITLVFRLKT